MEPINPYAVTRNSATHAAYRAYVRGVYRAGQPFIALGVLPMLLMPGAAVLMGDHALQRWQIASKWPFTAVVLLLGLGGLSIGVGLLRMAKYRREHPIPDEWRPLPRSSWRPVPGRRPRLR